MRMTGSWHLYRPGETWRKRLQSARVVIQVEGWLAVCFNAPLVEIFRVEDRRRHPGLGSLGPDLCRPGVDLEECVRRMPQYCDGHDEIGDVLLDQRIAAVSGTSTRARCCGRAASIPAASCGHSLLARASSSSRPRRTCCRRTSAAVSEPPVTGGLAVYGRAGKPCLRCHTPIEVMRQGVNARVTYWCPGCQLHIAP